LINARSAPRLARAPRSSLGEDGRIPALRAFGASASSRPGSLRSLSIDEYARLIGYPPGKALEGAVLARAEEAIAWYDRHGKPRVQTRAVGSETVAAITAGSEVEKEIAKLWAADRVDEAYFLDRLAAAVVEHLAASLGNGRSPGHKGFPLSEQARLYALVDPSGIEILPSGMLRPTHSLLAVYGAEGAPVSPCLSCDWRCSYRRKAA
jgi:hypothetical protein